jgi:hypothetical protein
MASIIVAPRDFVISINATFFKALDLRKTHCLSYLYARTNWPLQYLCLPSSMYFKSIFSQTPSLINYIDGTLTSSYIVMLFYAASSKIEKKIGLDEPNRTATPILAYLPH